MRGRASPSLRKLYGLRPIVTACQGGCWALHLYDHCIIFYIGGRPARPAARTPPPPRTMNWDNKLRTDLAIRAVDAARVCQPCCIALRGISGLVGVGCFAGRAGAGQSRPYLRSVASSLRCANSSARRARVSLPRNGLNLPHCLHCLLAWRFHFAHPLHRQSDNLNPRCIRI